MHAFFSDIFRWLISGFCKNLSTDARETTPPGPYNYLRHQHMSRDQRFYFPSEGRRDQGFFVSEKPRGRLELNPDPLGCRATTLTTTPPAPTPILLCTQLTFTLKSVIN